MSPAGGLESGATILELLVVLGLVAGLSAIAAVAIPRRDSDEADLRPRIEAFIRDARLDAIAGGEAQVLELHEHSLVFVGRELAWDPGAAIVLAGGSEATARPVRRLVAGDGSIAGPALEVRAGGTTTPIPGLYRARFIQAGVR